MSPQVGERGHGEHRRPTEFKKLQYSGSDPIPMPPLIQQSRNLVSEPDTPASRTGPPRSLSLAHIRPKSPTTSSYLNDLYEPLLSDGREEPSTSFAFDGTEFRGPLENALSRSEKIQKRRGDQRVLASIWIPATKQELSLPGSLSPSNSPHEEIDSSRGRRTEAETQLSSGRSIVQVPPKRSVTYMPLHRAPEKPSFSHSVSLPHRINDDLNSGKKDRATTVGHANWAKLRSFLPQIIHRKESIPPEPSVVTSNAVNITDELITGGLSTLMLKLWFERDEKDHRRIPILLHRLRIRVSDSLHPMHGHKSVFRIECEYANGAARWVVYRQLWDFWSLHTHYAVSNVYNRNVDKLPDFPKSIASLPYYKFLKKERGDKITKADFARLQRESLENYFIKLIRAVMFQPSANRLCTFLEISALSISLAHSNGAQFKAGFLRIESSGRGSPHFGRKSAGWFEKKEKRWCIVSDSYLVAMEGPGEPDVWDVFLFDSDFRIERPKRYYRQGFDLLFPHDQPNNPNTSPGAQVSSPDNDSHVQLVFHDPVPLSRRNTGKDKVPEDDTGGNTYSPSRSAANLRSPSLLLDPSTNTDPLQDDTDILGQRAHKEGLEDKQNKQAYEKSGILNSREVSNHTFYIVNSQMRLKLVAKNTRQMLQFITAFQKAAATSPYTGSNRFGSFAPTRLNVSAQWLVDGRDYFWNLSRAIYLAKENIYIHDWWLSPEVLLRRPNKDKYRLDKLLQRKAKDGVKICIILYQEVSNKATPTDSHYTKNRLINLHDNIMVQRSPSHFPTGTFYWAHHEKLCVIDNTIAFMGGLDLCFGRWDTPQHVLMDDVADTDGAEIWPGKDYSNPRMSDFYGLDKPEQDMYDRTKTPRMPWHDVGMQIIGQPARDLARHFVQRWNYLLRIKNHSKKIPFLVPPPDFRPGELDKLCLTGTCELQICRSAGPWSLGTPASVEHSIQTAYLKAIQQSEHFVYIENQFFITSTTVNDVKIENRIADTIVRRIIRAHKEDHPWKCCVVIPLLPGFTCPIDHSDASAVRIILECQNRTICRGPNSIFARLRKEGINPDDYIGFFSLRNWGKTRGDVLTTEQVYIHSKICIVDDRLVIIGSANINERSQRGDRDSELAAVIRDTDMIESSMAGQLFKVGRFAHTLRVRLMREHLGIDVDSLNEENLTTRQPAERYYEQEAWDPDNEQTYCQGTDIAHIRNFKRKTALGSLVAENVVMRAEQENMLSGIVLHLQKVEPLHNSPSQNIGGQMSNGERMNYRVVQDQQAGLTPIAGPDLDNRQSCPHSTRSRSDEEEGGNEAKSGGWSSWTLPTQMPKVDPDDFADPISDEFWNQTWNASAVHNTEIFRKVFHAIPDDHVATWKQYKEYVLHHERLNKSGSDSGMPTATGRMPSETGDENALPGSKIEDVDPASSSKVHGDSFEQILLQHGEQRSRNAKHVHPFDPSETEEMEKLLGEVNGHLVLYPTKFLEAEAGADNFLFNADRLLPLPIYV